MSLPAPPAPARRQPRTAEIEPLERRQLLCGSPAQPALSRELPAPAETQDAAADATPPTVTGVRVLGGPNAVAGVVLTFSEALDPARAQRAENYQIFRRGEKCDDKVVPDGDPFEDEICEKVRRHARVESATYDDASRSVTLTSKKPFQITARLRRLRIETGERNGVADAAGNRLDGDQNGTAGGAALLHFDFNRGRKISYQDGDRDRVRLQLAGPGKLFLLRYASGQPDRGDGGSGGADDANLAAGEGLQLWLQGRVTERTILTGSVTPDGRTGDGRTTLLEILDAGPAQVELLGDPAFVIGGAAQG